MGFLMLNLEMLLKASDSPRFAAELVFRNISKLSIKNLKLPALCGGGQRLRFAENGVMMFESFGELNFREAKVNGVH